jgi:hypothetical protein
LSRSYAGFDVADGSSAQAALVDHLAQLLCGVKPGQFSGGSQAPAEFLSADHPARQCTVSEDD